VNTARKQVRKSTGRTNRHAHLLSAVTELRRPLGAEEVNLEK